MECHVSTQANIRDARGVAFCREIGSRRVTLSRELTLQEIARIAQEGARSALAGGAHFVSLPGISPYELHARGTACQPRRLRTTVFRMR